MYRRTGREAFIERMVQHGISARKLAESPAKLVAMVRTSLIRDYASAGDVPNPDDAWLLVNDSIHHRRVVRGVLDAALHAASLMLRLLDAFQEAFGFGMDAPVAARHQALRIAGDQIVATVPEEQR